MHPEEWNKRLEKFWAGELTLEDENILKEEVSRVPADEMTENLIIFQHYVSEMSRNKEMKLDDSFHEKILATIDKAPTRIIGFPWRMVAAAAVVICLAGYFAFFNKDRSMPSIVEAPIIDTYDDPAIAYAEVQKALLLLSDGLNSGLDGMHRLAKLDEANDIIQDHK